MARPLVVPWLRGYQRAWLLADVGAGLALAAVAVPEQMATARLANMPAVVGLYAFVAGSLVFALVGRDRHISVGADSTIAPALATGVAAVAAVGSPEYANRMALLAVMVGVMLVAVGLLRLGWISEFLSTPVVTGVLAGIAVTIAVRQLPAILGVAGGGTTTIGRLRKIGAQIGDANGWSIAIAVGVLAVMLAGERVDRRVPGALLGLVSSMVFVAVLDLRSRGVATIGSVRGGLPPLAFPSASLSDMGRLLTPALAVTFVCVAQTAATARTSRSGVPATGEFNRDLVALGAGNLAAGMSGSFAVNSSPPRTEVAIASGGRSQLAGVIAALAVAAVVLFASGILSDLPQATLGAILLYVASKLFRIRTLGSVLQFDRLEFALAIVAMVAVAMLGIELGVGIAMLVSLAERTHRTARPSDAVLEREIGTDHWIPTDVGSPTEHQAGVVVYLMYGPLWYGNADYVRIRIREAVAASAPIHGLVLDANGMSDIDYTGAQMLSDLADELRKRGVQLAIARSSHLVHHDLKHSGLLVDIGADHLFASVQAAVDSLARGGP